MKVTISFIHLEHTPSLDERIQNKSKKLEKFLGGKGHVKWHCYVKENQHYAEVDLIGPHYEYHATASTDSLYKTIDQVVGKLEKQISKRKEKWKNKMHRKNSEIEIVDPEQAWLDYDEDAA